jgi:hypothetical protein
MDNVVHVARREISNRGHDRIEHVLLEIIAAPMLDVGLGRSGDLTKAQYRRANLGRAPAQELALGRSRAGPADLTHRHPLPVAARGLLNAIEGRK